MEKNIINCHVHLFNEQYIPDHFLPEFVMKALKFKYIRKPLVWCSKKCPGERVFIERYARFVEVAFESSQEDIFKKVLEYYPEKTQFFALPMDMDHMGAGKAPDSIVKQHDDLVLLKEKYPNRVFIFFHADPRNDKVIEQLKTSFQTKLFSGIKIYPALGYYADSTEMDGIYKFAEDYHIPIMSHCSRGGIRHKGINKSQANRHSNPELYKDVFKRYPELKICLCHFGGHQDWREYRTNSWGRGGKAQNWLSIIIDLIRSGEYPNLYADISSTVFNFEENVPMLKVLLSTPSIAEKVLFGSDYYMVEMMKFKEKDLSIYLRAELGEELFWKIAYENPLEFLGIP